MAAQVTLTLIVAALLISTEIIHSAPIDKRDNAPHKESFKVVELRQKLQRLHDILMNFDKDRTDDSLVQKQTGQMNHETHQSQHHHQMPQQQQQQPQHEVDAASTSPKERALSSEDMKTLTGDRDVSDLQNLVRRDEDNAVSILAKALAQLDDLPTKDSTGDYLKEPRQESYTQTKTGQPNDAMAQTGQNMASYIFEALNKLDNGQQDGLADDQDKDKMKRKSTAIEHIEARLLADIRAASDLGVSMDDLIEDLEGRAYRAAILRSIASILGSQSS